MCCVAVCDLICRRCLRTVDLVVCVPSELLSPMSALLLSPSAGL